MIEGEIYLTGKTPLITTTLYSYGMKVSTVVHPTFDGKLIKFLKNNDFELGTNVSEKWRVRGKQLGNIIGGLLNAK